jgi:cobalt-zinc-cadmium efflux system outer membrane protein
LKNPVFNAELRFPEGGGQSNLDLSVAQEFLGIFMLPLRRRIASARFEEAKLRVTGEVLDLAGEVRAAFFVHEGAQQLHALRTTAFEATGPRSSFAQRLHEAGNLRDLDLANERALQRAIQARRGGSGARRRRGPRTPEHLARAVGEMPPVGARPASCPTFPRPRSRSKGSRAAPSSAVSSWASRARRSTASRQELGLARSTRLAGELELGGVGGARRRDVVDRTHRSASDPVVRPRSTGHRKSEREAAPAPGALRRQRDHTSAARCARLRAASRCCRRKSAITALVLLPLRQQILDDTQKEYNAMQIGAFQLLQAKQQEIEAGSKYVETLRDYWIASNALGQLASGRRSSTAPPRSESSFDRSERRDVGHATGAEQWKSISRRTVVQSAGALASGANAGAAGSRRRSSWPAPARS